MTNSSLVERLEQDAVNCGGCYASGTTNGLHLMRWQEDFADAATALRERDIRIASLEYADDEGNKIIKLQTERIAELEAGLKPFAQFASWPLNGMKHDGWVHCEATDGPGGSGHFGISIGDFHKARAILSKEPK